MKGDIWNLKRVSVENGANNPTQNPAAEVQDEPTENSDGKVT